MFNLILDFISLQFFKYYGLNTRALLAYKYNLYILQIKTKYGPNLDSLGVGRLVGLLVDQTNQLHLYVDGVDQGVAANNIPSICHVVLDVYGRCEQVMSTYMFYYYTKPLNISFVTYYLNYFYIAFTNANVYVADHHWGLLGY